MFARISTWRVRADVKDETVRIISEIMLPSASRQKGFKDALIFRSTTDPEKHVVISMWETVEDLRNSRPPAEILPDLQILDEYITENNQDICEMLFHIS